MKMFNSILWLAILLFMSCQEKPRVKEDKVRSQSVKNLNNQEISVDSINYFVKERMKDMKIPGVSFAIINNGKIAYHNVMGFSNMETKEPVKESTLFEGASTSKPVFASLVMLLVEDGLLDLDTPLYIYLNEKSQENYDFDSRYKMITARMVLSHTTGFPNWRGNNDLTISFEPGTDFSYSGEGYQYLVKAVESILKTDYLGLEDYFQKRMAIPLGLKHTRFVQDNFNREHKAFPHFEGAVRIKNNWTAEEFNAASALHTESLEFGRWLIAILNDELWSAEISKQMFKDQITSSQASRLQSDENALAWTLGFAKYENSGHTVYGHEGNNDGFNALFLFDKKKKWGLIQYNNANGVYDFGYDLFGFINQN